MKRKEEKYQNSKEKKSLPWGCLSNCRDLKRISMASDMRKWVRVNPWSVHPIHS